MLERILLVEDHPIVQLGFQQLIATRWPEVRVSAASSLAGALTEVNQSRFDVAVVDLNLPDATALESITALLRRVPDLRILVLSLNDEAVYARRAFQLGAVGYLSKDRAPTELIQAIERIASGGRYMTAAEADRMAEIALGLAANEPHELLSTQEYRVLMYVVEGRRLTEIGELMNLSPKTVTTYRARILEKLGASNNRDLIQYCVEHGLSQL